MRRVAITIIAILVAASTLSAEELATSTETLESRVEKNEKRTATLEKLRQYFRISGFMQGQYSWEDDRQGNTSTGSSSFHLRRIRFTMTGDLYKGEKGGRLDYRIYFDLTRVPKNPVLDMWIRYQPCKEFGVQLGQFKNPFTLEASLSPSTYEFIDYSYAVCNLAKMGANDVAGLNVTARDMGFMFIGGFIHRDGFSILNYHLGVVNGNGINTMDNNKSKDIFARLTVKPLKELNIAAYYQWGEANLKDAANYSEYNWSGNAEYVTTHRWGVGLNYDGKGGFVRSEYIAGLTGNLTSEGLYVEAGKRFYMPNNKGMLWAGAMVDYYCRNCFDYIQRDTKNAVIDLRYQACVGYTPFRYLRVQIAYALEHRLNRTFANNRPFGNSVKLLVTGAF